MSALSLQSLEESALTEWEILRSSNVVRGLVTMEGAAIGLFVEQVLDGKQALTLEAIRGWLAFQVALILVFLLRHALAGIEVALQGKVSPELVKRIEEKSQARALAAIEDKHPEAAETLRAALATPPIGGGGGNPGPAIVVKVG